MAYTVLARRYRSKSFDELIGQEAIARTLRAAIDSDRVAHAYLFTGTRGVGKTSSARLFAKELAGNPDLGIEDEVNASIMRGEDTDVIEIDGASNNRVEEARELIANASYRPLRGKRKVYIIDEVHMLTTQAFNALLKTMEEPPEHVVFILCTTEAEKVPATIQSRCQRFDFRPISSTQIAGQLNTILDNERVKGDAELVHAVARLGNGSMRDALSVMDRLLASGQDHLTLSLLEELLGLPGRGLMGELLDAIAEGDVRGSLERVGTLLGQGLSADRVLESLAERLHDLLLLNVCGEKTELVDLESGARGTESARAEQFDEAGLTHMIALCEHTQRNLRSSALPRALLDAAVVRMAAAEKFASVGSILQGGSTENAERSRERPKKA